MTVTLSLPSWLTSAKSIAIVGFGREGKSTYHFLRKYLPKNTKITIYDEQIGRNDWHQFTESLEKGDEHVVGKTDRLETVLFRLTKVIFKSPGVPLSKINIHDHAKDKIYISSQADLFTQLFGKQMIAVTGTKGKSTTSHVISHILNTLGHKTILVGNIGEPALDFVNQIDSDTTIVFEMSSFQTESLHTAPHVSVLTSLYQDHLDYYDTFEEYKQAKRHLFDLQTDTDICLYRCDDSGVVDLLQTTKAKKIGYSKSERKESQAYIEDDWIIYRHNGDREAICPTSSLKTQGKTNQTNMLPGLLLAKQFPFQTDPDAMTFISVAEALKTVEPLPGRLELIETVNGVKFYDDALATIPEATVAALEALPQVQTLIIGGQDRGQHFEELAQAIADSPVETLILFPTTGERIASSVQNIAKRDIKVIPVSSMKEAVKKAFKSAQHSLATSRLPLAPIVLLSTASPSFGLFADYRDRSAQYKLCIQELASSLPDSKP